MKNSVQQKILNTSRGTLDVALATNRFIVVASDSRRSSEDGHYEDNSKKLFAIENKRVLAIAGLAGATITALPWLTTQIAPLLEVEIERSLPWQYFEDTQWNDPPPPENLPDEFRKHWGSDPYHWWNAIGGPVQTITNIALTFDDDIDFYNFALVGLLAGFKDNGEAKIERLLLIPKKGISNWGRPYVGTLRASERVVTTGALVWMTAGVTVLAEWVLGGDITNELMTFSAGYSGISSFLQRRLDKTTDSITESDAIDLARDLIRATADLTPKVGREPIQLAVLGPHDSVFLHQPTFPTPEIFLPSNGTWHLGVVFTPDFPFNERKQNVVYTFCEMKDNTIPMPLGDNHFYGCTFEKASFIYNGGKISFGRNNSLKECRLTIEPQTDTTDLKSILSLFTTIESPSPP